MTTTTMTPREAGQAYGAWIARTRFADTTKAVYLAKVQTFLRWVEDGGAEYAEAMVDEHVRDYAVRDYRRMLLTEKKLAVATIELHLSAIGSLYDHLGLGAPRVPRQSPKRGAPKGLAEDDLRKVLRGAERRGPRDYALASTLFLTAVRVSECAALDVDDVFVSERMGTLQVRHGKGGKSRDLDIPAPARAALRAWMAVRRDLAAEQVGAPLWIARGGTRLSVRRIQSVMADIGADVGVDLSPHVLRHTFGRRWVENGGSLVELQDVLGHANLNTTAGYTRSGGNYAADMGEKVAIDL